MNSNLGTCCSGALYNHSPLKKSISSFDRFRSALKGTWKDLPLPANGLTYDLAAHLIDQVLVLFGRPVRVTAFIENLRGIGSPEVDDNVNPSLRSR